jgi:hypothetical protein
MQVVTVHASSDVLCAVPCRHGEHRRIEEGQERLMKRASDRSCWLIMMIGAALVGAAAVTMAASIDRADNDDQRDEDTEQVMPDAESTNAEQEKAPEIEPARVVVRAGRNEEAIGYLKLKDDSVIVVETLRGEIKSYPTLRVLDVIYLVDPEPGQQGIVVLRDGQSREGIIIADEFEHVILEVEGIRTRLLREIVDRVILKPTFQQQYEQFVSTLDQTLPQRTILMCRWLMDQRRYDLAKKHLQQMLDEADDPRKFPEASRLLRVVEAQLVLQGDARRGQADSNGEADDHYRSVPDDDDVEIVADFPGGLLSRDDVNLIRVYELDFTNPPRVTVRPETIRRLMSSYATHPAMPTSQSGRNQLYRADPLDIVKLMFELRARELYGEVQVHSEPHAMNIFRRHVHDNWLLNNCARCHSGPDAGRFMLHRNGYRDERVRYTNFMILERLQLDPQWPLVNYAEPEMSLIIQHGLPREDARLPHPDVPGWTPVFTRGRDRLKQESIRWIESMMQPRPEYPVEYEPPRGERLEERGPEEPVEGRPAR